MTREEVILAHINSFSSRNWRFIQLREASFTSRSRALGNYRQAHGWNCPSKSIASNHSRNCRRVDFRCYPSLE